MRFQPLSHLTFWLNLAVAPFAAYGAHAQGVRLESTPSTPYPTVTDERLQHPEAGDWLMYRRTYDGSGFSPLRQISVSNVGKLSLAWSLNTDLVEAHETTPGVVFILATNPRKETEDPNTRIVRAHEGCCPPMSVDSELFLPIKRELFCS